MLHVVSEDEIAGFRETLPRPVLLFVLDFAVFVLAFLAQSVQESQVQVLLVFAHVVSETDDVVRLDTFLAFFSQPDDFSSLALVFCVTVKSWCFSPAA